MQTKKRQLNDDLGFHDKGWQNGFMDCHSLVFVIPAKAGIQKISSYWIPASAGMTTKIIRKWEK